MIDFELYDFELSSAGETVFAEARIPIIGEKKPCVVILCGFKAFKQRSFFPRAADIFAESGFPTITFNYSRSGVGGKSDFYDRPDLFAENAISRQVADSEIVLDFISSPSKGGASEVKSKLDAVSGDEIYLLGHSLGGGVALILAEKRPKLIKKAALWASVGKFDRYTKRQKEIWRKNGYLAFTDSRTGIKLRLNRGYLEDAEKYEREHNLLEIASKIEIPLLFVHGKQDMTVRFVESKKLYEAARNSEFELVEKAGHEFGIAHPYDGETEAFKRVMDKTIEFFKE